MSTVAEFIRLAATAVEQLSTDYDSTVQQHGLAAARFNWSGYVLATLLPYLEEHGIDLMQSPYEALTTQLSRTRGATIFIFTPAHKSAYSDRLSPAQFSADDLRDYFNEFNETDEAEIGQAMLDGITSIRQSLAGLDADSVILFSIG